MGAGRQASGSAGRADDMEQLALAGQALELGRAVVLELDVGSFEKFAHRRRNDDLAMACRIDHARRDVHGQAANVPSASATSPVWTPERISR